MTSPNLLSGYHKPRIDFLQEISNKKDHELEKALRRWRDFVCENRLSTDFTSIACIQSWDFLILDAFKNLWNDPSSDHIILNKILCYEIIFQVADLLKQIINYNSAYNQRVDNFGFDSSSLVKYAVPVLFMIKHNLQRNLNKNNINFCIDLIKDIFKVYQFNTISELELKFIFTRDSINEELFYKYLINFFFTEHLLDTIPSLKVVSPYEDYLKKSGNVSRYLLKYSPLDYFKD